MKFLTECENIPPLGLPPKFRIYFKDDCKPSQNGTPCACLPEVSTCSMFLRLSLHINNQKKMIASFTKAIEEGQGFQLA